MIKVPGSGVVTATARRAARFGSVWLRDPDGRRDERAATSLVMFIMFFPLIVGSFGFGVDVARNIWIRTSLQNAVDTSVVGGAAVTKISSAGQVVVDGGPGADQAQAEIRKLYALNREDNPGLKCFPGPPVLGTTLTQCWTEPPLSLIITANSAKFSVHEQSTNAFLMLLGSPTQEYNLKGHAEVARINE